MLFPPQVHLLERRQTIGRPLAEVFAFFERPENLAEITPPWLGFRIMTPSPIEMRTGQLLDYTVRVAGLRVRWTTLIVAHDPPRRFIDQQIRGPYDLWRHEHRFAEAPGGTEMTDLVHYSVPLGVAGSLAHRLYVRPSLEAIFDYRARRVAEIFS